jgi:dephospho-CoA kinase
MLDLVIGITGTHGAGKDTVAKFFIEKGFHFYSHSEELRNLLKKKGLKETRENLFNLGNLLRQEKGNNFLSKLILEKLEKPAVVVSIRHPQEVEEYKKALKNFLLLSVDAPPRLRYNRIRARKQYSGEDQISFEDFQKEEAKEMSGIGANQQISKVMAMADFKITNDGTLKNLKQNLNRLYIQWLAAYN